MDCVASDTWPTVVHRSSRSSRSSRWEVRSRKRGRSGGMGEQGEQGRQGQDSEEGSDSTQDERDRARTPEDSHSILGVEFADLPQLASPFRGPELLVRR